MKAIVTKVGLWGDTTAIEAETIGQLEREARKVLRGANWGSYATLYRPGETPVLLLVQRTRGGTKIMKARQAK